MRSDKVPKAANRIALFTNLEAIIGISKVGMIDDAVIDALIVDHSWSELAFVGSINQIE